MRPVVNGLEQPYGDRVTFVRLDFDSDQDENIARMYQAHYHPAFVILNVNGDIVRRFIGPQKEADLVEAIEQSLP